MFFSIFARLTFAFTFAFGAPAAHAGSYADALREFQSRQAAAPSKFSEADRATMKRAEEALARKLPAPGLPVGERAPDFTLPDANGQMVRLDAQLRQGPVVLVFYRGAWCPYCNMQLKAFRDALPELHARGAQLIAITPQKPDRSREQFKADPPGFSVLSDLSSETMKAYRLYFEVDPALVAVYRKVGLDLAAFNGEGREVLPVAATFVIDRAGVVRAMRADTDYRKRMEPSEVLDALDALDRPRTPLLQ